MVLTWDISFALKYSQDSPDKAAVQLNSSLESNDNVAYGSDFEEAQEASEDFGDDFEELDDEEDELRRRVRFKPQPVSDVFVTRDKYAEDEVPELFYTAEETHKFSADYTKEMYRAKLVEETWYEWWEKRTEKEWEHDDEENGKLSATWSDSEANSSVEEYTGDLSDSDNDFSNF